MQDRKIPNNNSFLLPIISDIKPEGSSMKILAKYHAEMTRPTRVPVGSNSSARIGRNELTSPIPRVVENPMKINSKYMRGYFPFIKYVKHLNV